MIPTAHTSWDMDWFEIQSSKVLKNITDSQVQPFQPSPDLKQKKITYVDILQRGLQTSHTPIIYCQSVTRNDTYSLELANDTYLKKYQQGLPLRVSNCLVDVLRTIDIACILKTNKNITHRTDLSGKPRHIYETFRSRVPDVLLLQLKTYLTENPFSGRAMDMFLTSSVYINNLHYFHTVGHRGYSLQARNNHVRFNISLSYQSKLKFYTKTYFDCFGRGCVVIDTLSNGTVIHVPIAQYIFYEWAYKHMVIEFMLGTVVSAGIQSIKYSTPDIKKLMGYLSEIMPHGIELIESPIVHTNFSSKFSYTTGS